MEIALYVQTQSCILRILYGKLYSSYVAYVYIEEFVSLIENQRVGIFPPKIKNSLPPIISFKMISKLPGFSYSCRRRYVAFVEKREFFSLMGNQRVGIFPPKSKNSLLPENIFHLISKNPGLTFSARRSHVAKIFRMLTCTSERRNNNQSYICEAAYVEAVRKKTLHQSSRTVTRPSADFQTKFFRRFKPLR